MVRKDSARTVEAITARLLARCQNVLRRGAETPEERTGVFMGLRVPMGKKTGTDTGAGAGGD